MIADDSALLREGVADRSPEEARGDLPFDQIVGDAGARGELLDVRIVDAGEKYDRRMNAARAESAGRSLRGSDSRRTPR